MTTSPIPTQKRAAHEPSPVWSYLQFFGGVVVLLMLIIGGVLLALNRHIATQRHDSRVDNRQLADVGQLGRLGSNLDSGLRGYFLTGSDKYLEPYRDAELKVPDLLDTVRARLDARDLELFERVRQSLDNKRMELARNLAVEQSQGRAAALELLRSDVGQALMDDVRADTDLLRGQIAVRIQQRTERVDRMLEIRDGVLTSLILVALLVSMASLFLLRAQVRALRVAQEERDRADAANMANREKSTFLANMSHEIRTPMNAIFGFAQLLKDTVKNDREKFYVQAITQSGQVLLGLINDILDMSKIEAGKLELHEQPTDLREVLRSCETLFSHMGTEKGLLMQMRLPDNLPPRVLVDPLRLRQVIINLIGNAMKYTEAGSIITQVSTQPSGDRHVTLVIAVTDTGIGIPADKQQKIFEPFIQLDNSGLSAPGAGLGLSIVRRIVELMEGTIRVDSIVGKGSTFTVRLPHIAIDEAPPSKSMGSQGSSSPLKPLKIVVVDDIELNRRLIEGLFMDSQHQVLVADGGLSGVALAAKEIPDVVLMDIRMPDIDGVEALRRIRQNPALEHTRVIAATASSLLGEEGRLRRQFDGYLRKPITREMLDAELRRFFAAVPAAPVDEVLVAASDPDLGDDAIRRWNRELPELCEFVTRAARTMSSDDVGALVVHMKKLAADDLFEALSPQADAIANAAALFDVLTLESQITQLQTFCDQLLARRTRSPSDGTPPPAP